MKFTNKRSYSKEVGKLELNITTFIKSINITLWNKNEQSLVNSTGPIGSDNVSTVKMVGPRIY